MIRILLVDDQAIIREALKVLLEQEQDLQIVGTANDGNAAIAQVEALKPDVLLIDIVMPKMDGIAATQIIRDRFPETKTIVLSGQDDDASLANALQAGAQGYLLKNTAGEDLANTIRSVYRGHAQLGPGLLERMVARVSAAPQPQIALEPADLSMSEPELLSLLADFDIEALPKAVGQAIAQKTGNSLLTRLGYYSKEHPTNLSALYLIGALLHRSRGQQKEGFQYLQAGFREGVQQKRSREELLLFYQEGVQIQAEVAFSWLTQPSSPWNTEEEWSFLLNEAQQRFGKDSISYRGLLVLRQIRAIYSFTKACSHLGSKLDALQQGLDRLENILKL